MVYLLRRMAMIVMAAFLCAFSARAQDLSSRLAAAWRVFDADPQLTSAMASIYVADAATGVPLFERNSRYGLAPASTQKVITAATAYALLGADFQYTTGFRQAWRREESIVLVDASGDPTLGSMRWRQTSPETIFGRLDSALRAHRISGVHRVQVIGAGSVQLPGGWIWEDLGNYYGAAAQRFNWRENQFDVFLRSGERIGDPVTIDSVRPYQPRQRLISEVRTAAKGSGDNAYIYLPIGSAEGYVRGTIPAGEKAFSISGAMWHPAQTFENELTARFPGGGLIRSGNFDTLGTAQSILTVQSPPLDSMVYWFNRKSINLYGEAFLKTIGAKRGRGWGTEEGLQVLDSFWKAQNIVPAEMRLQDGSGLSPQNRVTTQAQVQVLLWAKRQPWYRGFFHSLPEYNGMKLKSGTIGGVKGFAGYHRSRSGREYAVSFLVNGYNGSSSALVRKMFLVLDVLK